MLRAASSWRRSQGQCPGVGQGSPPDFIYVILTYLCCVCVLLKNNGKSLKDFKQKTDSLISFCLDVNNGFKEMGLVFGN